jgi:hypothetical protein
VTGTDTSHTEAERAPAAEQPRETQDHLVARDVVRALVEAGVRDVVLAPGSRSAPLAHALHSAEGAGWLRITVRIDERVAGFVALGLSRAGEMAQAEPAPPGTAAAAAPLPATSANPFTAADTPALGVVAAAPPPAAERRPVAIVTTSGTAVANLHPAVLEADAAGIPLILLTADRPHELRGTGANQTTQQVGIFGPALRHAVDAPAGGPAGRAIAQHVRRAVAAATGERTADPGPVQLNLGFREPLAPSRPWVPGPLPVTEPVVQSRGPATPYEIERGPRTVVIAGDGAGPAARRLAEAGSWPLLAEPSSSARGGRCAVPAYRELLDLPPLGGRIERVVVLGHPTLSRAVSRLLAREDVDVVVCAPTGRWPDAAGSGRIVAPDVRVTDHGEGRGRDDAWLDLWLEAGRSVVARLATPSRSTPSAWPPSSRARPGRPAHSCWAPRGWCATSTSSASRGATRCRTSCPTAAWQASTARSRPPSGSRAAAAAPCAPWSGTSPSCTTSGGCCSASWRTRSTSRSSSPTTPAGRSSPCSATRRRTRRASPGCSRPRSAPTSPRSPPVTAPPTAG